MRSLFIQTAFFATLAFSFTMKPSTSFADESSTVYGIGYSSVRGTEFQDCGTLASPSQPEAFAIAVEDATSKCNQIGFHGAPTRNSDFKISANNCVWGGPQYHFPYNRIVVTAEFQCH